MNPKNLLVFFIMLMALAFDDHAQAKPATKKFEAVLKDVYRPDGPGATVIVAKNGKILFRRAYGMANIELNVSMQPGSVLRLGSITKQFTAAAIMSLIEKGELSLTDEIIRFLPDYPVQGHQITIEHLLNHTSGIHSYTAIPDYLGNPVRRDLSTSELLDVFKELPMDFAPGDAFRYNNSGYVLLGAIIEKVTGDTYAGYINSTIFEPLGMKNSHYGGHQLIRNRVAGYQLTGGNIENAAYVSMTQPQAAGSLLSTVDDLLRWDTALYKNKIITGQSLAIMTTRTRMNNGEQSDYGFGLGISTLRNQPLISHGGGIHGFLSIALRLPVQKIYVAVLSNIPGHVPDPGTIARKLAAIALDDPFPEWKIVDIAASVLGQYIGVYQIDEDHQRTVSVVDGKLYTRRSMGRTLEVKAASKTTFFYENSLTWFEFEFDGAGKAIAMLMHTDGKDEAERATRISDEVPASS